MCCGFCSCAAHAIELIRVRCVFLPNRLNASQLVIGLANGWANAAALKAKVLYVDGDATGRAFSSVGGTKGLRGFGYWDIADDNATVGLVPKIAKALFPAGGGDGAGSDFDHRHWGE